MKIDTIIVEIAVLFLPGIVWALMDARYALKTRPSDTEFVLRAFIFGLISYAVTYIFYRLIGMEFAPIDINKLDSLINYPIAKEIIFTLFVGLFCSIFWLYLSEKKFLEYYLLKFNIIKKYSAKKEDVWSDLLELPIIKDRIVKFRDFSNHLVYYGRIMSYSENNGLRELVLRDVVIYDSSRNKMADLPLMYIARKPDNINLEFEQ